jgi:glutamate 5-kinase
MKLNQRIVVKVGTNVLTTGDGNLDLETLGNLVDQIAALQKEGYQMLLVSSGAVGAGKSVFSFKDNGDKIASRQVYSSIGQILLIHEYYQRFREHHIFCSQVLATKEDFRGKTHYANMSHCIENLLSQGVIPVINENDVVAIDELMFTDNDELAGLMAQMVKADKLIILSNVEGIFTGSPDHPESKIIPIIQAQEISTISEYIQEQTSSGGRGGMVSKFNTAKKAIRKGIQVHIAHGKIPEILLKVLGGEEVGTRFEVRG